MTWSPREPGGRLGIGVVVLPEHPWPEARHLWSGLDQLGVDHAWTFDHHAWRTLRDGPWFDGLLTLTAAAGVTDRLRLGTLVTSPNFRHPAVLAKEVMTLDHVSGGRFVLGLGAGAAGPDAELTGDRPLSPRGRADRFAEFVEVTDALLRQDRTDHRGEYFTVTGARLVPGCVQQPRVPLALAAAGPRGLALAARYADCWVTIGDAQDPGSRPEEHGWRALAVQIGRLRSACERIGRPFGGLRKLVNVSRIAAAPYASVQRFADVLGRCAELGFTDVVVNHPRPTGVFQGDRTAFEYALSAALS